MVTRVDTPSIYLDDMTNPGQVHEKRDKYAASLSKLVSQLNFLEQHDPAALAELADKITGDSGIGLDDAGTGVDLGEDVPFVEVGTAAMPEALKMPDSPSLRIIKAFKATVHGRVTTDPSKSTESVDPKAPQTILITDITFNAEVLSLVDKAAKAASMKTFGRNTELVQHSLKELSARRPTHIEAQVDTEIEAKATKKTLRVFDALEAKGVATLKRDMSCFAKALGSRYTYTFEAGKITPTPLGANYKTTAGYKDATVFIINGNNDLQQVEQACKEFLAHPNRANMHLYISGFGGHGTKRGPIFSKTEAETMGRLALNMGIPADRLHLETDATNSGENVQFLNKMIHSTQPGAKHFVMSGTNAAVYRQVLTLAGQSSLLDIDSISVVPTETPTDDYMGDIEDAKVYTLCYLRELATQVVYSMKTKYLAACEHVEVQELKNALRLCIKYFEELAKPERTLSEEQIEALITNYLEFTAAKVAIAESNGSVVLSQSDVDRFKEVPKYKAVTDVFEPINAFFRDTFAETERLTMPRLSPDLTLAEQTQALIAGMASLNVRAQMTQ